MDSELAADAAAVDPADGESVAESEAERLVDALVDETLGAEIAAPLREARRAQEARYRHAHPEEGLRERKRRLTRQTISDVATTLFATRGFEKVTVAEVAARVGVSEKTIYNYFPTKESMVLDLADEQIEHVAQALRDHMPGESLTETVLRALAGEMRRFDDVPVELIEMIPRFVALIEGSAALRAAWLEMHDRLARVVRDELAAQTGVDPRDPEVSIAARALVGLFEVALESRMRRIEEGLRGPELAEVVTADIERAARVLETGLWSFRALARGARAAEQAREAARAAEQARTQVLSALRDAREAWTALRHDSRRQERAARSAQRDAVRSRRRPTG